MAKEVENQGIMNRTDRQVFEELIHLHAKAAGESLSSILKADIEISSPEITEITVKEEMCIRDRIRTEIIRTGTIRKGTIRKGETCQYRYQTIRIRT